MKISEFRSQVYSQFAQHIAFPSQEMWHSNMLNNANELFNSMFKLLYYSADLTYFDQEKITSLEQLNIEFTSMFDTGVGAISLHERSYTKKGDKNLFEELFRFYQHFGLELDKNNNDFWPDALQVQLEFMHYLTHLESISKENNSPFVKGQIDFLQRHLLPLLQGIVDRTSNEHSEFYKSILLNLLAFCESEQKYLSGYLGEEVNIKMV